MDVLMIILIVLILAGVLMAILGIKKGTLAKKGPMKTFLAIFGVVLLVYGAVGIGSQFGWYDLPDGVDTFFLSVGAPAVIPAGDTDAGDGAGVASGITTYQPTATYTTQDKYSTTTISGTSYYKRGNTKASTTAQTNVNVGDRLVYWVDNSTYWVKPAIKNAGQGVTPVEAEAWANSTASVSLYDQVGRASATNGASNVSMGANDQANIEVTYQGTAEGSAGPFGGIMVAEFNSTISSLLCTGDVLLSNNPYHLTYTTSATTHTFKEFAYGSSLDDGSGSVKRIDCQFKNGASAVGAASQYYFKFAPADYYVTNGGDIVLDTEKHADGTTTRTGTAKNFPNVNGYWAA